MANYAVVKDGKVVEYYDILPLNWKNISGLAHMSTDELRRLGWFSVTKDTALAYDGSTQRLGPRVFVVRDNDVLETYEVINRSDAEVELMAQIARENNINELRRLRDQLLVLTDWTQLSDASIENKAAWAEYRQKLRDLMAVYAENYTEDYKSVLPLPPVMLVSMRSIY